jgi:hypothetical protein
LIDAGIIAALFGPGNTGNTNYGEPMHDGIPPIRRSGLLPKRLDEYRLTGYRGVGG